MNFNEDLLSENINEKKRRRTNIITIVLLVLCCFLLFTEFVWLGCVQVDGSSMNNTINDGDYLILDRLAKVKCGNVVVFTTKSGEKSGESLIKRVVAVGGDKIKIENGKLQIWNKQEGKFEDSPYNESFAGIKGNTYCNSMEMNDGEEITISEGCIFVLGDNRENSTDSRFFGEVNLDDVDGVISDFVIDNKDRAVGKIYQGFCGLRVKFGNFMKSIFNINGCAKNGCAK